MDPALSQFNPVHTSKLHIHFSITLPFTPRTSELPLLFTAIRKKFVGISYFPLLFGFSKKVWQMVQTEAYIKLLVTISIHGLEGGWGVNDSQTCTGCFFNTSQVFYLMTFSFRMNTGLPRRNAVLLTIWRITVLLSSMIKQSAWIPLPCTWRHYDPSKHRESLTQWYTVTPQKMKALWSFKTTGIINLMIQCHAIEDLNPVLLSYTDCNMPLLIFTIQCGKKHNVSLTKFPFNNKCTFYWSYEMLKFTLKCLLHVSVHLDHPQPS